MSVPTVRVPGVRNVALFAQSAAVANVPPPLTGGVLELEELLHPTPMNAATVSARTNFRFTGPPTFDTRTTPVTNSTGTGGSLARTPVRVGSSYFRGSQLNDRLASNRPAIPQIATTRTSLQWNGKTCDPPAAPAATGSLKFPKNPP